jgi:P2-related tail formation protein
MKVGRTIAVLLVSFAGAVSLWAQQPTPTPPAAQKMEMTGKPGMMDEKLMEESMMAHHKEMMAKMEAMDARLEELVKRMNAATGSKKPDAVAAVHQRARRPAQTGARTGDGYAAGNDEAHDGGTCGWE